MAMHEIYLRPSELFFTEESARVTTVLGSCISVTLHAPQWRVGAICHAVLPRGKEVDPSKYADQSVDYMLKEFARLGIAIEDLQAKLFGGSDMFTAASAAAGKSIGAQNIEAAMASLRAAGLDVCASDVGGLQGRKLIFHTDCGDVFLKRIPKAQLKAGF